MALGTKRDVPATVAISEHAAEFARDVDLGALAREAHRASDRAHAPHSGLRVGAALLSSTGHVITAGNVENDSYGLTICAERAAVVRAVAEGHTEFVAIAVGTDTDRVRTLACCGACLQVLAEFDPSNRLIVAFPDGDVLKVMLLRELMPVRFTFQPEES